MPAATRPKRILLVTQDFPPVKGGIQTYCLELVRALVRAGAEVAVLTVGKSDAPNPVPEALWVRRVRMHSSWLFLPLLWKLPRLLQRERFDVVLYAQWQAALPELLLRQKKHRSMVLVHGRELLTSVLGPLAGPLRQAVFARVDTALPNSRAVSELLIQRAGLKKNVSVGSAPVPVPAPAPKPVPLPSPKPDIVLCHPGVDTARFNMPDPLRVQALRERYGLMGRRVIVCLTRMVARKNLAALVEVMPSLLRRMPEAALMLCGEGPEKASLMAQARALNLGEHVLFPGRVADDEMTAHYGLADVFALPALQPEGDIEGFGIVYLEAAACGVAVVGARTGGIPDAVSEGETGLLIDPHNLQELEGALLELLQNPQRAQAMGQAGRARAVQFFTWDNTAATVLSAII
jgi:phosphatidyl-myo-inositol dimannoside synthase